jgi:hypothetical protein
VEAEARQAGSVRGRRPGHQSDSVYGIWDM